MEQTAEEMFNRGEPPWSVRREVYRRGIAEYGNFRIVFDLQDYDTLLRCASQGLELSRGCGDELVVPTGLRVLAQAALRAARFSEAVTYADEAHAAAEAAGNDWETGLALAAKAAIAVRQGKLKSAQRAYETALEVLGDNNRWGSRRSSTDWARWPGAGQRRHGAARSPSPLTPREHEIVLLIAQGLSNREIADELVIRPATAARHVASILAKLGFSSRTQVASWATRHEPSA